MFSTERLYEFDVGLFVTVVGKDAQQCLSFVQRLHCLPQPPCHTIVNHRKLEDLLNSIEDVHRSC